MGYRINLQIFAGEEKTEKATPKKRKDVREEGQVVQSREVSSAFILLAGFIGLKVFGKKTVIKIMNFMRNMYSDFGSIDEFFIDGNLHIQFLNIIRTYFAILLPIVGITFLCAILINYLQVGFLFTTKTLKVKFSRINPIEGFKRIFSKRALVELLKSIVKIAVLGYAAYSYCLKKIDIIVKLPSMEPIAILKNFSTLAFGLAMRILGILIALAILDYFYQWHEHEKNIMMTTQELKEEYKQTEGDPLIKSRIKEKQRKMAYSRMMQDVPKADVIITNPTHIAVAIKYDRETHEAPYLVAKGVDLIAEKIKKIAGENSIPIVENKPLARSIFNTMEIGEIIPEELYQAVAEVLAYVYSLKDNV